MVRSVLISAMLVPLFAWWIVLPVVHHATPTSRDITVKVLAQPFVESPRLVYRWSGAVERSCDVTIRRSIIDSDGVVTNLISTSFDREPVSELGWKEYEVVITVPQQIAEGRAIYQAVEIPKCDWLQRLFPKAFAYPPVEFSVSRTSAKKRHQ